MTQTQEHLLKLVLEIDQLCRKHGIQYFLAFGSILGAVRHHGFIPWDNDVDLSMPEEDYEKFRRVCREELDPEHRVFVDNRDNREYPVVFGHYVDRDSCRMTNRTNFWDDYVGQCIDIFCMVELPPDPEEARMAKERFFAYDEFVNRSYMHYTRKSADARRIYRAWQERAAKEGRQAVIDEAEAQIFGHHYEGADTYMLCSARSCDPSPCVPKRPFNTPLEVPFEGHPLFIPGDYVTVLMHYYGEDFNLFPRDKRIHTEMSHAGLPSRVYVQDFMADTNRGKMLRDRAAAKDARTELCLRQIGLTEQYYRMQGIHICSVLRREREARGLSMEELAKTVDQILAGSRKFSDAEIKDLLSEADGLFDEYWRVQLDGEARYWRAHLDIGEDAEYCALAYLWLVKGDRKRVRKQFALRSDLELVPTPRMRKLEEAFDAYSQVRRYLIYREAENALPWLEQCRERFGGRRETLVWQLCYLAQTAGDPDQISEGIALADRLLAGRREDLCVKAKADLLRKQDRTGEADSLDRALEETCEDGFILLDIAQRREGGRTV